jgi:GNAT superfamily N-acetyltransferase
MTQELLFRPYAPEDLHQCLMIFDGNCPRFFADHEGDAFLKYLQERRFPYFVVTDNQHQVLACGGFAIEKGVGELAWGMVRSDIHRKGVGRYLFKQRLYEIRKAGVESVKMDTSQYSLGFYLGLGFKEVSRTTDGYGPGLHRIDLRLDLHNQR